MMKNCVIVVMAGLMLAGCTGAPGGEVAGPVGPQAGAAAGTAALGTAAFAPNSDDEIGPNGLPAGTRSNSAEPDYGVVGVGHLAPF